MHKIFSVYDSKAEVYLPPFFMRTRGEAIRAFTSTSNDPESNISRFPLDFGLVELGEYDELKGRITPHNVPVSLGLASEFKAKAAEPMPLLSSIKNKEA